VSPTSRELLSVGIDVGTTTTQVVFSRLTVRDTPRLGVAPRIEVDARSVLYEGPAHFTPLSGPDEVDVNRLVEIVTGEYATAGIPADDVDTGAVIITGETARTSNADAILSGLAAYAGDFVVTVAGPSLEAQIAGRGSGAAAYSRDHYTEVTNVDVGGGSTNAAVFRSGAHLSSAAAMVGGRQLELEPTSGLVRHLAPHGRILVERLGLRLAEGSTADVAALREFTDAMAEVVVDLVLGVDSQLFRDVHLTPPLVHVGHPAAVFLSGGVGRCYFERMAADTLDEIGVFGDVGPLLARSLRESPRLQSLPVMQPAETIRATVIGAASQTVTVSGTTIWTEPSLLPLRNLPVIEPAVTIPVPAPEELAQAVRAAVRRWDAEGDGRVAIALDLPAGLGYADLTALASGLAEYAGGGLPKGQPLVVVTEHDYAQSLGQTVKGLCPDLALIVVDQIGLGEGDFIDIGQPMLDGRAVPVSVKTLVFHR
jgi:ethanolamine utilization protein EutA